MTVRVAEGFNVENHGEKGYQYKTRLRSGSAMRGKLTSCPVCALMSANQPWCESKGSQEMASIFTSREGNSPPGTCGPGA